MTVSLYRGKINRNEMPFVFEIRKLLYIRFSEFPTTIIVTDRLFIPVAAFFPQAASQIENNTLSRINPYQKLYASLRNTFL